MKKQILMGLSIATISISLVSCGGDTAKKDASDTSTTTTTTEETSKPKDENYNLLTDKETLAKAQQDLMNLPKFRGKTVNVFQHVHFYGDGRIMIELSDPDKPTNIDHYEFNNGKWSEPEPVQITGDGDMKDNLTPLSDIKFDAVPTIYNNWMEKAKGVEGAKMKLDHVYFTLVVHTQNRYWNASSIEGTREKYNVTFNLDGSVKEFDRS